ncbi:hypothetical protein OIE13_06070 [Streptosporangium sp. NBC_01810]|uniref:hypothetical protein n=1 Tax=Streptosporangium sp. NBC_01810 TaxID=2975951 RepID=UPI002DDB54BB|nr:hypothetical protein [Streptosporangium sp. NBC_01810]WSA27440.1 hypothetical protein OIE13_06070 [Streptosporangium sp. NBC_01810]
MSYPEHPLINIWAVIADPDIPDDVVERLIDRQAARRDGRTPNPVPEDDKPWLARHIAPTT